MKKFMSTYDKWKQRRKLVKSMKRIYCLFGLPYKHLTDDEMYERALRFQSTLRETIKASYFTAKEAAEAFKTLAKAGIDMNVIEM